MTPEERTALEAEIARTVAGLRQEGIPDALNRWLDMTPEKLLAMREQLAGNRSHDVKIGPKEAQQRALRAARADGSREDRLATAKPGLDVVRRTPDKPTPPKPAAEPPPAKPQEPTMTTPQTDETKTPKPPKAPKAPAKKAPAKKAPAKAAKKPPAKAKAKAGAKTKPAGKTAPAKVSARPDGLREGSKQAVMIDMALRPEGATEAEMCKKLGWKRCRVTLGRVAEKIGAKLTQEKNKDDVTVWKATLPKAK